MAEARPSACKQQKWRRTATADNYCVVVSRWTVLSDPSTRQNAPVVGTIFPTNELQKFAPAIAMVQLFTDDETRTEWDQDNLASVLSTGTPILVFCHKTQEGAR